jgi:nitrogen-specific signal transduction histidine kinase
LTLDRSVPEPHTEIALDAQPGSEPTSPDAPHGENSHVGALGRRTPSVEKNQTRRSQKLEAIGQLASGIAHDFNNLLQIIQGNVELLGQQELDPQSRDLVEDIAHASGRATQLVLQLLAFSREEPVEVVPVRIDRIVFALLGMLQRLLGEDIAIEWSSGASPLYVVANATQLEQVVVNLCINARDAMPSGGRLRISVDREWTTRPPRSPGGQSTRSVPFAVLTIEDDGQGMTPEVKKRIFEPFFTTKAIGQGTGLGLSTVHAIVAHHGGFVEVDSAPGDGSRFRVHLPTVEAHETTSGTFPARPAIEGGGRLVLIAEDDRQIRNLTERFLKRSGFSVVTATNGREAEAMIVQYGSALSLVILDALMPHVRGPEICRRMRTDGNRIPCLIMTGCDRFMMDPIGDLENIAYLQKPFDGRQLFDRLSSLLDEA